MAAVTIAAGCTSTNLKQMESPDGKVLASMEVMEDGSLNYSVSYISNGESIIALEASALGIERKDASFSKHLRLTGSTGPVKIYDHYTLVSGKQREISYEANEYVFSLENEAGQQMQIIFRASDDGIAYKYHFPGESKEQLTITQELSSFNMPDEGYCWSQAYDTVSKWTPAYETFYERKMKIGTTADPNKNGWSFPITFHTNDLWVMVTESNLDGSYPASHLQAECKAGEYRMRWPEESECFGEHHHLAKSSLPWSTPWRVVIVGETPATIIESTLVTDLADPCKIDDTTWIKPGRAAWSWWSDSDSPQLVREQKRFVDLAVEMGWEYNLIDANWDNMKDGDVRDAINYGNKKGIGSLLWYNSGGLHNSVTEAPRNRMWDPEIRKAEFETLADWGVKGVKVDFFQSDKQAIINQYLGILKDAASNKVMANFHGCTLPRGWNRTYPNMVSLEAVRGGEVYKFGKNYPEYAPWHNVVLAFTRNVVGPMDYTPVMLSDHTYPHLTSYAHELATAVVFESGITHMADKVEAYLSLPDFAKKYLQKVPVLWDEIKFIDGYPGDYVILARRSGDVWYVAALNGINQHINMDFIPADAGIENTEMRLIMDGESQEELKFSRETIDPNKPVHVETQPNGGFIAIFSAK